MGDLPNPGSADDALHVLLSISRAARGGLTPGERPALTTWEVMRLFSAQGAFLAWRSPGSARALLLASEGVLTTGVPRAGARRDAAGGADARPR